MKTQAERDNELIASATRMVTFARPSFIRLCIFTASSAFLSVYQLTMQAGGFKGFVGFLFSVLGLIAMVESARFAHRYDSINGGWKSSTRIMVGFIVVFLFHRLFDYLAWGPTHRTLGWSIFLWFGYILGVLISQVATGEEKG